MHLLNLQGVIAPIHYLDSLTLKSDTTTIERVGLHLRQRSCSLEPLHISDLQHKHGHLTFTLSTVFLQGVWSHVQAPGRPLGADWDPGVFLNPLPPTVWFYVGMAGAFCFILIQLVLLIDFAHSWNESWVEKMEEGNSRCWYAGKLS